MASASGADPGGNTSLEGQWSELQAAEDAARAARTAAFLTARGPEGGVDPSRPVPPDLPSDAWAVIMDRAASCRCAGFAQWRDGSPPKKHL